MHEGIAPKTTVGYVLKQFCKGVRSIGLVARPRDEPFTLLVVDIPCGHTWKHRSQRSIEAHAAPRCVSPPFATSVPCTEIRRNTWHKWHNFCSLNRVRSAGSAFHSTRAMIPKLNVEGSNPFARFAGDGWRGCGGKCAARNRAGGEVGGLLGRRPRTLQLNQPDWRPALRAVHSNTSVAVCFAERVRTVLWRTLGAISSSSWAAYALKLLCRKGCVGGKIL